VTEKQLNGAQVSCSPIDQRRLRSPLGVGAVLGRVQAELPDPAFRMRAYWRVPRYGEPWMRLGNR
jgi:hypothetical protein